jgi:hypothetical protein
MTLDSCRYCKLLFLPVNWLPYRVRGFCSKDCTPEERERLEKLKLKKLHLFNIKQVAEEIDNE